MEKHLHIIALTIPYPVDYGGVYDLFYKLPSLQAQGVQIHLHCFEYGRKQQEELNKYCVSVHYYPRNTGHKAISTSLPYIVASRKNDALLNNLLQDEHPILMEGVHCTYLLNDSRFKSRRTFVRIHNVEYDYYYDLAVNTTNIGKKLFYYYEHNLLRQYEKQMAQKATAYWAVTEKDTETYRQKLHCTRIDFLPPYLPTEWKVNCLDGTGNYCLYQGDLSIDANEKAAIWLMDEVFLPLGIPLVISGKNPSNRLQKIVDTHLHTCLCANPSVKQMQDMVAKAQMNILPSYSKTGIKLKLLNALYNGRHVLTNPNTVAGSGVEALCHVFNDAKSCAQLVTDLMHRPFTIMMQEKRAELLHSLFSNEANAKQQVQWIWG